MKASNHFQSMKSRIIKLLSLMFLLLTVVTFVVLYTIMLNRIRNLEDRYVLEYTIRAHNDIFSELQRLSQISNEWAERDDTYAFIQNRSEDFIANNLGAATFTDLEIDVLSLIDTDGIPVHANAMDQAADALVPISRSLADYLAQSRLVRNTDPDEPMSGIILLPEGPMLLAAAPILSSNGKGPARGLLVIGEYLDDQKIKQIGKKLKLVIRIERLEQRKDPITVNSASDTVVRALNAEQITGQSILYDMNGLPAIKLVVQMDREVSKIGKQGLLYVLIVLIAFCLLSIVTLWFYIDRKIITRLKNLNATIISIGRSQSFAERLPPQRIDDEISIVSNEINAMLGKLEESQLQVISSENALKTANTGLEIKISQRTADLEMSNGQLQSEIVERQKAQDGIKHLAYHDPLTNLPNRLMFTEHLNHAIRLAGRADKTLAVIFLDLDAFKMINDTMGHASGDRLLQEVASRLAETLRKSDIIARIGGDEFIALVENIEDPDAIKTITDKILHCFHEPFKINDQHFFITTSIGVALFPTDGPDAETIIKNADIAMYKAKELGKNQSVFCSPIMKSTVIENANLTNFLHWALERNELELYYQPQIRCDSNQIVGVEALLRWHHPDLGMVSPAKFIPLAEQSGVIIPIGEWVLRTACRQCAKWHQAGYTKIRMGVNLSIKQFQCADLVHVIRNVLDETGLDPGSLELEITESIAMKGNKHIVDTLQAMKDLGISIAIDDFGTEYSSLNYLKQLPIKALKIALPFVQGIDVSEKDEAITKAVIAMAKSLGLELIAEGVETKSQLDFLTQRLCDEVQGYYYYKPMTGSQFDDLLRDGPRLVPENQP